jgi:hypothetical protein
MGRCLDRDVRGLALWAPTLHHVVGPGPSPAHGGSIRFVALIKRQRNEIFEVLREHGIDPQDCTLTRDDDNDYPGRTRVVIVHKPTGSEFNILGDQNGGYRGFMTVGDADQGSRSVSDWSELLHIFDAWAGELSYEADTPDLWAELQQVSDVLTAEQVAEASNAPFTPDEQAEITRRLDEIKHLVREKFELTDDQLAAIDQRMDDAEEAAEHTGRKTWLYTFYGAVMSTVMTDEIPPHVIQTIVSTVLHGIGHLFGLGGSPPIIST